MKVRFLALCGVALASCGASVPVRSSYSSVLPADSEPVAPLASPISTESREDLVTLLRQFSANAKRMEEHYTRNPELAAYWHGVAEGMMSASNQAAHYPEMRPVEGAPTLGFVAPIVPQPAPPPVDIPPP